MLKGRFLVDYFRALQHRTQELLSLSVSLVEFPNIPLLRTPRGNLRNQGDNMLHSDSLVKNGIGNGIEKPVRKETPKFADPEAAPKAAKP